MDSLEDRVECAKQNSREMERLLSEYLPFIKKQARDTLAGGLEHDDKVSIAMMVFVNCVSQYQAGRGSFLTFAKTSIRNRLIDESRKMGRAAGAVISLREDQEGEAALREEELASLQQYEREEELRRLGDEIDALSDRLNEFGITFSELAKICPRQDRAKRQCRQLAAAICGDSKMRARLLNYNRISQSELSDRFKVSPKTLEKHRKYIVALVVLMDGDYPGIQTFLPREEARE